MEDLNKYFDKARKQGEIVSVPEIERIITREGGERETETYSFWTSLYPRKRFRYAMLGALLIILAVVVILPLNQFQTNKEDGIFIPDTQRRVMHLVKNISDRPENREIRISQFGSDNGPQISGIPIHLRSKFELSEENLKLLGITFTDTLVKYEGNVKGRGYVSFSVMKEISTSVSVNDKQQTGIKEYEFYPWFLTNEAGFQGVRYRFDKEPALKMTNSFFYNVIDQLIPIQIDRPGFRKVIFWFSQTPELMSILESAAMISNGTEISDGLSGDKINQTIEMEIFPTITSGDVTVITKVLKEQTLEIALLNASGQLLQVPVSNQLLDRGEHSFSMDLSTLKKGLYFVRIKSNPGVTTVHRLFKE